MTNRVRDSVIYPHIFPVGSIIHKLKKTSSVFMCIHKRIKLELIIIPFIDKNKGHIRACVSFIGILFYRVKILCLI